MLGLPKATELSKQLPKNAIYAKFQMNTVEKAKIDADISRITIVNEVSADKVHIAAGEQVKSFFVLLVALKKKNFDDKTIIPPCFNASSIVNFYHLLLPVVSRFLVVANNNMCYTHE